MRLPTTGPKASTSAAHPHGCSVAMSAELFEKLYVSPQNQVKGDLRKTFGNPTPMFVSPAISPVKTHADQETVPSSGSSLRSRRCLVTSWDGAALAATEPQECA